jgi:hypothetical protein
MHYDQALRHGAKVGASKAEGDTMLALLPNEPLPGHRRAQAVHPGEVEQGAEHPPGRLHSAPLDH